MEEDISYDSYASCEFTTGTVFIMRDAKTGIVSKTDCALIAPDGRCRMLNGWDSSSYIVGTRCIQLDRKFIDFTNKESPVQKKGDLYPLTRKKRD